MDNPRKYRYSPLPSSGSIRLFSLSPAKNISDVVVGHLEAYELDHCPEFEAVSYVWGDVSDRYPIFIQDSPSQITDTTALSCVLITQNLTMALIRFRNEDSARLLWADAICIDQDDRNTEERAQQILSLGRIFSQASRVLVWLDYWEDDSKADEAFSCMRMLARLDSHSQMLRDDAASLGTILHTSTMEGVVVEYNRPTADEYHAKLKLPEL